MFMLKVTYDLHIYFPMTTIIERFINFFTELFLKFLLHRTQVR